MNKSSTKKSPNRGAFAPKADKGSMPFPVTFPAPGGNAGAFIVFRANAKSAAGTVAVGVLDAIAKVR